MNGRSRLAVFLACTLLFIAGAMTGTSHAATAELGRTAVGDHTDSSDSGFMNATRHTTGGAGGTVTSMSVYVGRVSAAPADKFQLALYTDSGNAPGSLLARSATGTLAANSWNTLAVSAVLRPETSYWLVYNTNGSTISSNNMKYADGGRSGYSQSDVPFGTWPTTFGPAYYQSVNFSMYATYTVDAVPEPDPDNGPGGPVLVISDPANPFTRYYGEILKAEGLNHYRISDLGAVTAATLAQHDLVVLGQTPLTNAQVSMLTTWTNGGGGLIAMRPDKKLAPLLGLTATTGTLRDAYVKVNTSAAPGAGITADTMGFHGTADRYTLNGATTVATLYSGATTATANPAVTLRQVGGGGGQAAAFTYDLARSVVRTRQGNIAWAGQQRDGTDAYQASEMFFGTDGQPDWNNLDKAIIPVADEQQRLLANTITHMNRSRKPLRRFWYFPRDKKAVVVMTGDDHANGGTAARWDRYLDQSPPGCSVADWECVRASSYVYNGSPLTAAQAKTYHDQGFEVGLHVTTACEPWGPASALDGMYLDQLNVWSAKYATVPRPSSSRTHCVEWDDWDTQAKLKQRYGMRLDTDYYYYPASFTKNRPGYFNGTAQIMRFADEDGRVIDTYQATTQMTDESGQSYPYTVDTLLNAAHGPQQYYAALTANMHTDKGSSPESDAVVASARARGVPVVSGRQMLAWLDARNSSAFADLAWSGGKLTFRVTGGANGLRGMVPLSSAAGTLTGVTFDGSPVTVKSETVKGVRYGFFDAVPGTYTASYAADSTAPSVTSTVPAPGAVNVKVTDPVKITFSEPLTPSTVTGGNITLRDAANNQVAATVTLDAAGRNITIAQTLPLSTGSVYSVRVQDVEDPAGNALAPPYQFTFRTGDTASLTLGNTAVGGRTDEGDSHHMNGSRITTGTTRAALTSMSVNVGGVSAAPADKFQMAVYADDNGKPGALVASTAVGTLTANTWNTLPISATLSAETPYWLMYNTNGTGGGSNNMRYDVGDPGPGVYSSAGVPFGTWPADFGNAVTSVAAYSLYATY